VQLCDFGLVVVGDTTGARLTTTGGASGTVLWMSPQRLEGTRYRITEADDVYAYACLGYYVSFSSP
jgi:serine/threonine protein kinase